MIHTKASYRVSFAGGGTDFPQHFQQHGGKVIGASIDYYVHVFMHKRFETSKIRVSHYKVEEVDRPAEIEHEIVRAVLQRYDIGKGWHIDIMGELPGGTGLASSSALTTALLRAVKIILNKPMGDMAIASEAVYIETEVLKKPIGWQDQYSVAFPGINTIRFSKSGDVLPFTHAQYFMHGNRQMKELEENTILVLVGQPRKAETILHEQVEKIEENKRQLKELKNIADNMSDMFANNVFNIRRFGDLLSKGWDIKSNLSGKVTNKHVEDVYNEAIFQGAYGGKLLGAGGGGFMLFAMTPKVQKRFLETTKLKSIPFRVAREEE